MDERLKTVKRKVRYCQTHRGGRVKLLSIVLAMLSSGCGAQGSGNNPKMSQRERIMLKGSFTENY